MGAVVVVGVERITTAAIYVDDGKTVPARRSHAYPATGLVFAGWRHGDCFTTLHALGKSSCAAGIKDS